jgi:hypothetical protein
VKLVNIGFLTSPTEPEIRIEDALDCDGDRCGLDVETISYGEERTAVPPHSHMIESQLDHAEYIYPIRLSRH